MDVGYGVGGILVDGYGSRAATAAAEDRALHRAGLHVHLEGRKPVDRAEVFAILVYARLLGEGSHVAAGIEAREGGVVAPPPHTVAHKAALHHAAARHPVYQLVGQVNIVVAVAVGDAGSQRAAVLGHLGRLVFGLLAGAGVVGAQDEARPIVAAQHINVGTVADLHIVALGYAIGIPHVAAGPAEAAVESVVAVDQHRVVVVARLHPHRVVQRTRIGGDGYGSKIGADVSVCVVLYLVIQCVFVAVQTIHVVARSTTYPILAVPGAVVDGASPGQDAADAPHKVDHVVVRRVLAQHAAAEGEVEAVGRERAVGHPLLAVHRVAAGAAVHADVLEARVAVASHGKVGDKIAAAVDAHVETRVRF